MGKLLIVLLMPWLAASSALALDLAPDYLGVGAFWGTETSLSFVKQSDTNTHEMYGASIRAGKTLDGGRYRLMLEPALSRHKSRDDQETRRGTSIEAKIWLLRDFPIPRIPLTFFLGVGGGFLHLSPSSKQPNLGNSGFYGILAGSTGFRIPLWGRYSTTLEYRLHHISDVIQDDSGRNFDTVAVGVEWSY